MGCITHKSVYNSKIYKSIYDCQKNQGIDLKPTNSYREQLNYLNRFEYSKSNDTIFILEMYGIQGDVIIAIWNKSKILSYTNKKGYFENKDEALFTKQMIKLISEWNIPEIRKEEDTNSNLLSSELIYAK
jgi:hypothetical protein